MSIIFCIHLFVGRRIIVSTYPTWISFNLRCPEIRDFIHK